MEVHREIHPQSPERFVARSAFERLTHVVDSRQGAHGSMVLCLGIDLHHRIFRQVIILSACLLSLGLSACHESEEKAAVPDGMRGIVVDAETKARVQGVLVEVFITERGYVSAVGPEGTVKHKIAEVMRVTTDENGLFSIDTRSLKKALRNSHPSDDVVMGKLLFRKAGYADLYEKYVEDGQTFALGK